MYPTEPYPGYTWSLTQHMGKVSAEVVHQILLAAYRFRHLANAAEAINRVVVASGVLPENYRTDRNQVDLWRDYQQILSELGLIYSTEVMRRITLTPLGLALIDGTISYTQMITMQVLRYQYPNGHKVQLSKAQRNALVGSIFANSPSVVHLQTASHVQIRPGVLVWRVLRLLLQWGEDPTLTVDEIEACLMRCSSNKDAELAARAIVDQRSGRTSLTPVDERNRRNAQDWHKFLTYTPLFRGESGYGAYLTFSTTGQARASEVDLVCDALEQEDSFWNPRTLSPLDRVSWYSYFGSVDLALPQVVDDHAGVQDDGEDVSDEDNRRGPATGMLTHITLRLHEPTPDLGSAGTPRESVRSEYDAERTRRATRLHHRMVDIIAETCKQTGAEVYEDPQSVDLLIVHDEVEYLIEVKSVTPANLVARLRYAIGQVLQYAYIRSTASSAKRRHVIALAARVPADAWYVKFLNEHLDMDLISLDGEILRIHSLDENTIRLFS